MNTRPRRSTPTLMVVALSIASAAVVTACGPEDGNSLNAAQASPPATTTQVAQREAAPVRHLGRVTAIEAITERDKPSGAGAAIGGVAGGVIGNQFGRGSGRTAATVIGAVGGAVAGNEVEKRRSEKVVGYRVSVHMDNGETRSVRVASRDGLDVGERVRVEGNQLIRL